MQDACREFINIRYRLIPYLYTLFYLAHTEGTQIWEPMFYEFGDNHLEDEYSQFMIGRSVMAAPVLSAGATSVDVYFPSASNWYDYHSNVAISPNPSTHVVTVPAPVEAPVPLYVRGGNIIPTQQEELTTTEARQGPLRLLVALARSSSSATGVVFDDDGVSLDDSIRCSTVISASWNTKAQSLDISSQAGCEISHRGIDRITVLFPIKVTASTFKRCAMTQKEKNLSVPVPFDVINANALALSTNVGIKLDSLWRITCSS